VSQILKEAGVPNPEQRLAAIKDELMQIMERTGKAKTPALERLSVGDNFGYEDYVAPEKLFERVKLISTQLRPEHRALLREMQTRTRRNPKVCARNRQVILFYGPPGAGKTSLMRILAKESGLEAYKVDQSAVLSKSYGESLKNFSGLLEAIGKMTNSIVFFDEVEFLLAARQDTDDGSRTINNNLVSTFLSWVDGLHSDDNSDAVIVLATNLRKSLDKAVLSRCTDTFFVPLPTMEIRIEWWARSATHLGSRDHKTIAKRTANFSFRDLEKCANMTEGCHLKTLEKDPSCDPNPSVQMYVDAARSIAAEVTRSQQLPCSQTSPMWRFLGKLSKL
jgi:SpoVK/Ycf46/Vps4 family AAA+-type ATPase